MPALLVAILLAGASPSIQSAKLDDALSRLDKLRSDAARRKYREPWEAILRELDRALRADPKGARAAETALAAARVRAELFGVSRRQADAKAALAALRKVDDDFPGPLGQQALYAAVQLSWHTKDAGDRAAAAKRLCERYPESDEAKKVAAKTAAMTGTPAPALAATVAAAPAAAADDDSDDDDDDATSAPPEEEAPADPPSKSTPIVRAVKTAVAALTEPGDEDSALSTSEAKEMRKSALKSGLPLAQQLGLKVRRIVVDAGHGGKDTGAIGPHGVREKDMTLAIARKLAARLKSLGFQVVMTRNKDVFVPLDDRTRIANEAHADLFVSVHCNAARRRKLEGVETWTLNVSSDRYAARLAAFENAEAERTVSDLRLILADLATKANASDARDLAQSVQSSLVRTLRSRVGKVRDHGVKQALFYVLLGTHMPSILVETGFISNPSEEARLKSLRFQDGTAEAIARGVKDFVDSRRRLASVP